MSWLTTFLNRFLALFRKAKLEDELDQEVRFHLEMEIAENLRRGMNPEEARYAALRQFGGVDQAKEAWRDRRWLPQLDQWARDARFGLRSLARSPGFTIFAVLSLALGIGANTAIYTMIRALVLQPLPYPEPWGLVKLWEGRTIQGRSAYTTVSAPNLGDWREQNRVFEDIAAFSVEGATLTYRDSAIRLVAAQVEPGVFPIMRIAPYLGRTFRPEENVSGADRVVVLSHGLWERSFGADRAIVGKTVPIGGAAHTVVGVMPPGFRFPPRSSAELWVPLGLGAEAWHAERGSRWLQVIARLKPGVSWVAAHLEMNAIARRLERQYPLTNANSGVRVQPLHPETVKGSAQILLVLAGAVGFVLLLACANVAHLVLARAAGRRRELGVRMALGAGRWRIVRLLAMESALVAAAGGVAGYFGGRWCLDAILAFSRNHLPPGVTVEPDVTTVWFCVIASLFSALLAGVLPSLRVSRIDLQSAVKEAGSATGTALGRNRSLLMTGEVALALALAVGALLLMRSLRLLNSLNLGFQPEHVLTMKVDLPDARYQKRPQGVAFFDELLEQVRAIPGVITAGTINFLPVQFCGASSSFTIPGRADDAPGHEPVAERRVATPGYFQAMGIPLAAGRYLNETDRADSQPVVLLSRYTAQRYFPNENPVGSSIRFGSKAQPGEWKTIVGIVGDIRDCGVYRSPSTVVYEPVTQSNWGWRGVSLAVRSRLEPAVLTTAIRRLLRERDPDAALYNVKTMESVVSDSVTGTRILSRLLTVFGALAVVLAIVGVYGVMAHLVSQRTHEIGVRMALGASRGGVLRLVLRRSLSNALAGVVLGLAMTVMARFAIRHFLIGIRGIDLWTYGVAVTGVFAVVLLASFVPAWRASRVDPLVALRDE